MPAVEACLTASKVRLSCWRDAGTFRSSQSCCDTINLAEMCWCKLAVRSSRPAAGAASSA